MTKPTQGVTFKIFQDQLIGVNEAKEPNPIKPKNIANIK